MYTIMVIPKCCLNVTKCKTSQGLVSDQIGEKRVQMRILLCVFALTFSKPYRGEKFCQLRYQNDTKVNWDLQKRLIEPKVLNGFN